MDEGRQGSSSGKEEIRHRVHAGDGTHPLFLRERSATTTESGTLLYIHGLGESCLCFEGLMQHPRLAAFRHLGPDLPGYGRSPWPEVPLRLEQHAQCLARFLGQIELRSPLWLVGHSMGGVIGTQLLEILCDVGELPVSLAGFLDIEGNVSLLDCGFSGPVACQSRSMWLEEGFSKTVESVRAGGEEEPALERYWQSFRLADPRTYHRNSRDLVAVSMRDDLAQRRAGLDLPLLYVLGSPDGTGARSRALLSAAGIPWQPIHDAGHWPFIDQLDDFVALAAPFLSGEAVAESGALLQPS